MGRFRVIKSKGRFYVITTDSNGLAGGPFDGQGDAQAHADRLAVLEAMETKRTAELAAKAAQHPMNITPGYRSPDVEDRRSGPPIPGPSFFPPAFRTPALRDKPPGWEPPWTKHHLPSEPVESAWAETPDRPPPGGKASLSSLLPKPSTWGDIRVRMGLPYRKAPGER